MWWVHTRIVFSVLPDRRLVLEFKFRDQREWFWIMRDSQGPSICRHDPGFGIDAAIESNLSTMYRVWLGDLQLTEAIRDELVVFSGTPAIVRRLPTALQLSPIAGVVAATSRV